MKRFVKNICVLGLVILVLLLSVVIGVVNATNPDVTFVENVVQVVVTPLQKLFTNVGNGISDFFGYFSDIDKLAKESSLRGIFVQKLLQMSESAESKDAELYRQALKLGLRAFEKGVTLDDN